MFSIILIALQVGAALANTEKVIFLGPSTLQIPVEPPTLENLQLDTLSPAAWSVRTHVEAEFPTDIAKYGQSKWLLLHSLEEGRRYEVRICWAATQPTSFRLDTYELPAVFKTPHLITSLAQYSKAQQSTPLENHIPSISQRPRQSQHTYGDVSSTLLLHIQAAADYYTTNQTLMMHVPPVSVDIILDPYVLNILPRSLVPTVVYIIILAIGGWYLAKWINKWISLLAIENTELQKKTS